MKVLNVYGQKPVVTIVNDRDIKFAQRCYIDVITDEGCLSYDISPGNFVGVGELLLGA